MGRLPARPPDRPRSMQLAVALMYGGAGLTVLSTVIFFATKGQLADSLAEANPQVSRVFVDRAVDRLQGREVGRTILGVALWVWMAVKNGQGRKWARVVATVFGVINLVGLAFAFVLVASTDELDPAGGGDVVDYTLPYLVLAGIIGVLAIVTLVQMYHPDSSRFYDESSRWNASLTLRGY